MFQISSVIFLYQAALRYPKLSAIFQRALDLWAHDPAISSSLLKLMTELTQNRSQRLLFDIMSPNGVLLFREVSKTVVVYGEYC